MYRSILLSTLAVGFLASTLLGAPQTAHAKRKMPPKTKVCNKTKHKQYVATSDYAGRGRHRTAGWTYIAVGTCHEFQTDAFHFRGTGKVIEGVDASKTLQACVLPKKVFSQVGRRQENADPKRCADAGGRLGTFYKTWRSARTLNITK